MEKKVPTHMAFLTVLRDTWCPIQCLVSNEHIQQTPIKCSKKLSNLILLYLSALEFFK